MSAGIDQNELLAQTILSTIERAVDAELEVRHETELYLNRDFKMPKTTRMAADMHPVYPESELGLCKSEVVASEMVKVLYHMNCPLDNKPIKI
jgi:hypothetical protein